MRNFLKIGIYFFSINLFAMQTSMVTLSLEEREGIVGAPYQSFLGQVDPQDAAVSVNGEAVTVATDGSFEVSVTLQEGLNTFIFEAEAPGYLDKVVKRDMYLDLVPPVIELQSPANPAYLNRESVDIRGLVTDVLDGSPTLALDGQAVDLADGRMDLFELPLAVAENRFRLTATDAAGNSSELEVVVYYSAEEPVLNLAAPVYSVEGGSFTVTVEVNPAEEIVDLQVLFSGNQVHRQQDGSPLELTLVHPGGDQTVHVAAKDRYGNQAQVQALVKESRARYIEGQVLLDEGGRPVGEVTLNVSSPAGQQTLTTDASGKYRTYVNAFPVRVTLSDPNYVAIERSLLDVNDGIRVPDIRLTDRTPAGSLGGTQTFDAFRIEATGFPGQSRLTSFGAQAMPALLPLGWSPLFGFEIHNTGSAGGLELIRSGQFPLPEGYLLTLMRYEPTGWRVVETRSSAGGELRWQLSPASEGAYLLGFRDLNLADPVPEPGDLLVRNQDRYASARDASKAEVDPAKVTVFDNPMTQFSVLFGSNENLMAGTRLRVRCDERHHRLTGTFRQPAVTYDFHAYANLSSAGTLTGGLQTALRSPIDPALTQSAQLAFTVVPATPFLPSLDREPYEIGDLSVDFSQPGPHPNSTRLDPVHAPDLELPIGAETIAAFELWQSDPFQSPGRLALEDAGYQAVILLHSAVEGRWHYLARLEKEDGVWRNHPLESGLNLVGRYALVSLEEALVELQGTVTGAGVPVAGVSVRYPYHTWLSSSGLDGRYRQIGFQLADTVLVNALDENTGRKGTRSLPNSLGSAILVDQDIALEAPDFRILGHEPEHGQQYLGRTPLIRLRFNRAIATNRAQWPNWIRLTDDTSGAEAALNILPVPNGDGLNILPNHGLASGTSYTLSVGGDFQDALGFSLSEPVSFSFSVASETVSGSLDLNRFYLDWDGALLVLHAPETAFPDRTWLTVLNERTADADSFLLRNHAPLQQAVPGILGDPILLEATAADGTRVTRRLRLARLSDGSWQVGGEAFSRPLDGAGTLHVDAVENGVGTRIFIEEPSAAEIEALMAATPALDEAPPLEVLSVVRFRALDGETLPEMRGRLTAELGPAADDRTLLLMTLTPGVSMPASPLEPETLVERTLAELEDMVQFVDGQVSAANKHKFLDGGLSMSFSMGAGQVGAYLLMAIGPQTMSLNTAHVRSYREGWDRRFEPAPPYPTWPDLDFDYQHVPYVPLFVQHASGGVSGYRAVGVTDNLGEAKAMWFGPSVLVDGVDPVALRRVAAVYRSNVGIGLQTTRQDLRFESIEAIESEGTLSPAKLKVTWEVGRLEEADVPESFVIDLDLTEKLNETHKLAVQADLELRAVVTGDVALSSLRLSSAALVGEIEGMNLSPDRWTVFVPRGLLTSGAGLRMKLTAASPGLPDAYHYANFLMVNLVQPGADQEGAPFVVSTWPRDRAQNVPIDAVLQVSFSEPVSRIPSRLTLLDAGGNAIPLIPLGEDGEVLTEAKVAMEVRLVPQRNLRFGHTYSLEIDGVVDQGNLSLVDEKGENEPILVSFGTVPFYDGEALEASQAEKAVAHVRNLAVVLQTATADGSLSLGVYEAGSVDGSLIPLHPESGTLGGDIRFPRMTIFLPKDLQPNDRLRWGPDVSTQPLRDLPLGSVAAVAAQSGLSDENRLILFVYGGQGLWLRLVDMPLPQIGVARGLVGFGPYLVVGYRWVFDEAGEAIGYDIRRILEGEAGLRKRLVDGEINYTDYKRELAGIPASVRYPLPGDAWDLQALWRQTGEEWQAFLLMAGREFPGIFPFEAVPTSLVEQAAAAYAEPGFDVRAWMRTDWNTPEGEPMGAYWRCTGGARNVVYYTGGGAQVGDYVLFSAQNTVTGQGTVAIYELSHQARIDALNRPLAALRVPPGIRAMAVDAESGLFAIQTATQELWVLDLAKLLTSLHTSGSPEWGRLGTTFEVDPERDYVLLDEPLPAEFGFQLAFHRGSLLGVERTASGERVRRIPINVKPYRVRGWAYLPMNDWNTGSEVDVSRIEHADHVILHATDLDRNPGRAFAMEMATFEITAFAKESVEVVFRDPNGAALPDGRVYRDAVKTERIEGFSTVALSRWLSAAENQAQLRARGFLPLQLEYLIRLDDRLIERETLSFLVVYDQVGTDYQDGLDLSMRQPALAHEDYRASGADPRINLGIQRVIDPRYAFHSGDFGVGMAEGHRLLVSHPVWWPVHLIPDDWHEAEMAEPWLVIEQPSLFQIEMEVGAKGLSAAVKNDLVSHLARDGQWRLTHGETMQYTFVADRPLPDYPKLHAQLNRGQGAASDVANRMRYLLLRYAKPTEELPSLRGSLALAGQKDLPWGNERTLTRDGDTEVLKEKVDDLGGTRTLTLKKNGSQIGPVVTEASSSLDGIKVNYRYEEGYLTEVKWQGERTRNLEWEALSIPKMGSIQFKRLKKISQGDWFRELSYANAASLTVTEVTTPYGSKALDVAMGADGLPDKVTIPGLGGAPGSSRTFQWYDRERLITGYSIGSFDHTRTWVEAVRDDMRTEWLPATDTRGNRSLTYDDLGRVTQATEYGRTYRYDYGNQGPFYAAPTKITDPIGRILQIKTEEKGRKCEAMNPTQTKTEAEEEEEPEPPKLTWSSVFSKSGVEVQSELEGFVRGPKQTKFYLPHDGTGWISRNGRLERIPVPGKQVTEELRGYDKFGDLAKITEMGATTKFSSRDDLGRPGVIVSLDRVTETLTYGYRDNHYLVTTLDQQGGWRLEREYNELGWLVKEIEKTGNDSVTREFGHDAFGRLVSVKDISSNTLLYQATFNDHGPIPNRVVTPDATLDYQKQAPYVITGVTKTVEDQSRQVAYATDVLGRVTKYEEPGLGVMRREYDGLDRVIAEIQEDPPEGELPKQRSFVYGDRFVEIKDEFRQLTTRVAYLNNSGLDQRVTQFGPGMDANVKERTLETTFETASGLAYAMTGHVRGGPVERVFSQDALGNTRRASYGKYEISSVPEEYDRFGQWTRMEGAFEASREFDAQGRLTRSVNPHGQEHRFESDAHHRVTEVIDPRGKTNTIAYDGATSFVKTVDTTGIDFDGDGKTKTHNSPDRLRSESDSWTGAHREVIVTDLDRRTEIQKPSTAIGKNGLPATAALVTDPASGRLLETENFVGETTQYEWGEGGRVLRVKPPHGVDREVQFDAFDQVREVKEGGIRKMRVRRDDAQRVSRLETETRTFDYQYNDEDLSGIVGGDHPLDFEDHNAQGLPQTIAIGDVTQIQVSYHPGGIPACIVTTPTGGLTSRFQTNTFGDLEGIQRGFEPALRYTYNEWGAPATMQIGDAPPQALFSGDQPNILQLPAGVIGVVDEEGRLAEVQVPGLAPKNHVYDDNGRLTQILIDGQVLQSNTYTDGLLTRIESGTGAYADVTDFEYDGRGRLASAAGLLDGDFTLTFGLDETETERDLRHGDRVKTYTDANGATQTFTYDRQGRVAAIAIENGPSFHYDYDSGGNLIRVQAGGMAVRYENYEQGIPGQMTWRRHGEAVQAFEVTKAPSGQLKSIGGGPFLLDLTWLESSETQDCDTTVPGTPATLQSLLRRGPDFQEILSPQYDENDRLAAVTISRRSGSEVANPECADCVAQVIEESYGTPFHQLQGGLRRELDGQVLLDSMHQADPGADDRRLGVSAYADSSQTEYVYDGRGSLREITHPGGIEETMAYDGMRRLRELTVDHGAGQPQTQRYRYDLEKRRIRATLPNHGDIVYAYHGSRVLAMGQKTGDAIRWTHAFGHGPFGPAFVVDLTFSHGDAFIFTDHLGTPFAYYQPESGRTGYTPFNPWGEILFGHDAGQKPTYAAKGEVPTWQFPVATDPVFAFPPMGLSGHVYDHATGLTYMHHRYYHPRLGHFLTPDFRAPDIYDPSTFTEPYAYAQGNPIMFWDPDGRRVVYLGKDSDGFGWMGILYTLNGAPKMALISRLEWELAMKGQGQPIGNMKFLGADTDAFWDRSEFLQYQVLEQMHGYDADIKILPDPMKHFRRDAMIFTGVSVMAPIAIGAMIAGLPAEATIGIGAAHLGSISITAGSVLPVAFFNDATRGTNYTPDVIDALKVAAGIQIGHTLGYSMNAGLAGEGSAAWRNLWNGSNRAAKTVPNKGPGSTSYFENLAREATKRPHANEVVLGKYNQDSISYLGVAEARQATFFNLENWDDVVKMVGQENMWKINEAFLRQQLQSGKTFTLSHNPDFATGYFLKEVNFLRSEGFRFKKDGAVWRVIK